VGVRRRALVLLAVAAISGCGSQAIGELPPAAGPAHAPALTATPAGRTVATGQAPTGLVFAPPTRTLVDGRLAVLAPRARKLDLLDPRTRKRLERVDAGVGPTHVLAVADRLYVTDTQGGALLVFATRPKLVLTRRVFLPGVPYGIAVDLVRHRLWVTLTARNEVLSLPANGRPRPLVRLPTIRQPNRVAADSALGTVAVAGRDPGVLQLIGAHEAYDEDER
jgi:DNA-binding beta-propeller fold protein YncE